MFLQFFYIFPRPQRLRSLGQQQGISQIVFLQVRARRTVDRAGKLQRLIDRMHRSAALLRLDDDHRVGQRGDQAIAPGKVGSERLCTRV